MTADSGESAQIGLPDPLGLQEGECQMEKTVLCVMPVEARHKEKLEAAGIGCRFVYASYDSVTEEQIAKADVILGNAPAGMIHASPRLKILQLNSAGTDDYIRPGVLDPGTVLLNATGAYSKAVAEHALAMTLMLQKKLHLYRDDRQTGSWNDYGTVTSIADAVVLVIGLGDIGQHYAALTKALGAYTIGVTRRPAKPLAFMDEQCLTAQVDELLPRADVVVSFLPGSGQTYHFYDADRFARMKEGAFFLNLGRGGAADPAALLAAVHSGKLAGAGLDVTDPEPLPADSPLWREERILITPHVAGSFHLPETFERIVDIAAGNLKAWLEGGELRNIVDFATGYKR